MNSSLPPACPCTTCCVGPAGPSSTSTAPKGSVYDFLLSVGDEVATRYTAVAFDRPGSGFSSRLDRDDGGSPQTQAAVLRRPHRSSASTGRSSSVTRSGPPSAWPGLSTRQTKSAAVVTIGGHVMPLGEAPPRLAAIVRSRATLRTLALFARTAIGKSLVERVLGRIFSQIPFPTSTSASRLRSRSTPKRLINDGEERASWTQGLRVLEREYPRVQAPVVVVVGRAGPDRAAELVPAPAPAAAPRGAARTARSRPPAAVRPRRRVMAAIDRARQALVAGPTVRGEAGSRSRGELSSVCAAAIRLVKRSLFASCAPAAYHRKPVALGGEPAVPCTRNPLQRG